MDLSCLQTTYNNASNKRAKEMRLENINYFSSLSRNSLKFNEVERRLLLYVTKDNEKIYIQYPGKETISSNESKVRPWDFRPKLELRDGSLMKDLSFADIWNDLSEMHGTDKDVLSLLATIFFRMSQMIDYKIESKEYEYIDINMNTGETIDKGKISFTWLKPTFDSQILKIIQDKIGIDKTRGASLEAYLVYNDLLVQNEDCKYFYRDTVVNNTVWNDKVGRKNTLYSHMSVIEYLQGYIKFSEIMNRFQRGMGVAPFPAKSLSTITNGLVTKE